jgi:hypothetical protein
MNNIENQLSQAAEALLHAGLSVLPAKREGDAKRVALSAWKPYQERLPTDAEVRGWFANHHQSLCLVCGAVSGNLEMIDFDLGGEMFDSWCSLVREMAPGLLERLVIETTPSRGRHVVYRCEAEVCGNLKLAQRKLITTGNDSVVVAGKAFTPRKDGQGNWFVAPTLIETRGEGGIFLCSPSEGYSIIQGSLTALPVITAEEREILLSAAWALNEYHPEPEPVPASAAPAYGLRPGDDYAQRGDVRAVLLKHGWVLARPGENEYWRRPGRGVGWSATLRDRVFYVFSSNATPFEPGKAYGPFAVYAYLEHGGDFAAAARALRAEGYGGMPEIVSIASREEPARPITTDPGPIPAEMLRIPGFVSEVMDYTLTVAPYPNPVMAFAGALVLQAFLAGRKVRDPGDNRTNIYLLGLAHSGSGKDWPRKVNTRILYEVGLSECLGERFASGEGIQDALFQTPSMLFQTDEIDSILQAINKAKDARHEAIMSTLLTMYSSANSVFPMRRKAGKESPGAIDQPCLVIYGTAVPNHYYQALSERMLTNGFFARMIVLESGPRSPGQEPSLDPPPQRVLATAKWWAGYRPGTGNLEQFHPVPAVVEYTDEARQLLIETRKAAEAEYTKAEAKSDPVGTTVWGRVSEQVRKLSLLYAVSENHQSPKISLAAVQWASAFVTHQTKRMLFMAASHVAENPFHAECLRALEKLRNAPNGQLSHSVLLKRMKMDAKSFSTLVDTLVQQGDVEIITEPTPGRTMRAYRIATTVTQEVKQESEANSEGERS